MGSDPDDGRRLREAAAAKYKPDRIRLLLVAKAPPTATDRYFYFPDVAIHDSLFRYTARLVLGVEPTRTSKAAILSRLQDAGVFLIDLCPDPVVDKAELRACVEDLVRRATALKPDRIILIKQRFMTRRFEPFRPRISRWSTG